MFTIPFSTSDSLLLIEFHSCHKDKERMSDCITDVLNTALVEVVPNATGPPGYNVRSAMHPMKESRWNGT